VNRDEHLQIVDEMVRTADAAVETLLVGPQSESDVAVQIERLADLQESADREFPEAADEVGFWEMLWLRTDLMRDQWNRVEKAAGRAGPEVLGKLQDTLDEQRRALYAQTRRLICERAPTVPTEAHFELGIDRCRADFRGLHERIEGLYESIKRMGTLPTVRERLALPRDRVNFAIIYGGGWNVSTFSVLREAERFPGMNALLAFDHPGEDLYSRLGGHTVRVAPSGLVRVENDEYVLATFQEPAVLHFVCPHEWTGPPPHELGVPVLRSSLTLEIVDDKLSTSRALEWYAETTDENLPLIPERGLEWAGVLPDLEAVVGKAQCAITELEREGVREVVVKPCRGEQGRGVAFCEVPRDRDAAVAHAVRLALESSVVVQKRIRPCEEMDFTWRVLVALAPDGEPRVVGRFARKGRGDELEMVGDRDMLAQCGTTGDPAEALLERLDAVSLQAFKAVAGYARARHPDFPRHPLGGGSYAVPYVLGIDLIGDALVMEINGNEVAGMWTDDRLYPETRGRSSRTVLESAEVAALAYRDAIEGQGT
jgi:hypothetical protein